MLLLVLALLQSQDAPRPETVDSALRASLRAAAMTVTLNAAGRLGGPGGELLARETAASQFLLVGEEHGVAETPALVAALARLAGDAGYRHFGIEVGAQLARELNRMAAAGGVADQIAAFTREHPPGVPFYSLREEAELLGVAVAAMGGRADVLWGLDYDIVADRWLLPRLRRSATTERGRSAVASAVRQADDAMARALAERNPGLLTMFGGSDSLFRALRAALAPRAGSEVDEALDLMEETLAINRLFFTNRNYESNDRRGRLMKRQLGRALAAARAGGEGSLPRALFKFGASHMMRGRTFTNIFDVGGTLASLAELQSRQSFHLYVVGGPGSRHAAIDPTVFRYRPAPGDLDGSAALKAFAAESGPDRWTLFDVRPLRGRIRRLTASPAVLQIIFGFDAVLVLGGSTPATPLVP